MENVVIENKTFEIYIDEQRIREKVKFLADSINLDYINSEVLFIGVLNGSFIFAADLIRHIHINHTIEFVKVASYTGTQTSGEVKNLIGLSKNIKGKNIVIIEDIIDTGITLKAIVDNLQSFEPNKISLCSLLIKPKMHKVNIKADYEGFVIPDKFVVGYGLDFNGKGRNLKHIYAEK
ncbi:MAG: hypoxanthine phosphoribosyltransferase [Bacteroidia bacterium]